MSATPPYCFVCETRHAHGTPHVYLDRIQEAPKPETAIDRTAPYCHCCMTHHDPRAGCHKSAPNPEDIGKLTSELENAVSEINQRSEQIKLAEHERTIIDRINTSITPYCHTCGTRHAHGDVCTPVPMELVKEAVEIPTVIDQLAARRFSKEGLTAKDHRPSDALHAVLDYIQNGEKEVTHIMVIYATKPSTDTAEPGVGFFNAGPRDGIGQAGLCDAAKFIVLNAYYGGEE